MKIAYLINDIYGIGGTVRTVVNQAARLSERHDVEIASVFRNREAPDLPVPDTLRLVPLVDTRRTDGEELEVSDDGRLLFEGDERAGLPPVLYPAHDRRAYQHSQLTDDRIVDYLANTDADVLVGTRPGLNVMIARDAPSQVIKVGQEHLTYELHSDAMLKAMEAHYSKLDAFVTVTETDARTYAERMPMPDVRMLAIPNSVPAPSLTSEGHNTRTIVSAGRLAPAKRQDLLVAAFARVADDFPDWTLRIYGKGERRGRLQRQITSLGLQDRVWLMGPHPRVEEAWAEGAFAAFTSSSEAFGMTIVEAMRAGLAVVSTDCPHGPAAIIRDRENGLLVPNRSVKGIAEGLTALMTDDKLRRQLAETAQAEAEHYDPVNVVRRHEELFADLLGVSLPEAGPQHAATPPPEDSGTCRVRTDGNGPATLTFTDPPAKVVLLRYDGERIVLSPDSNGTVTVDPEGSQMYTVIWEVLRVDEGPDGEQVETPVQDVEIHQRGFPMDADETDRLATVLGGRSAKGALSLHVRRTAHHAEVRRVKVAEGLITVQGRVLGQTVPDAQARLVVRLREAPGVEQAFPAPVAGDGTFTSVVDPAAVTHGRHGQSEKWELRLVLSQGQECSVGRYLDGVVGYQRIIDYPTVEVTPEQGWGSRVHPYYTVNDRLGLTTSPLAPIVEVDSVRVRPVGRHGQQLRVDVRLSGPLPEDTEYAVEVVRGANAGQRFPLDGIPGRGATLPGPNTVPPGPGEKHPVPVGGGRERNGVATAPGASAATTSLPGGAANGVRPGDKAATKVAGMNGFAEQVGLRTSTNGRLVGTLPLQELEEAEDDPARPKSWRLRLLVGPTGELNRVAADEVPEYTGRRWTYGPYVRSARVAPLSSGDLRVTVADVHLLSAVQRRIR